MYPRPFFPPTLNQYPIMTLASRGSRLLGQMIDAVVAFSPFIVVVLMTSMAPGAIARMGENLWLPAMLACLGYLFFADAMPRGQSFGKWMLGVAVVDERTGLPCSAWQSFVRNVLLSILGLLDWIFIFGNHRKRLGDMVAGTLVVQVGPAGAPQGVYYQ
jgi:uncharacterized RDD family membrane protein YckC